MATQTQLTFVKVGEEFVATFKTAASCAIHIERPKPGPFMLGLSSVEGSNYARIEDLPEMVKYQTVIDYTLVGEVFPKYIKVTSAIEPSMALVVSEGEITPGA